MFQISPFSNRRNCDGRDEDFCVFEFGIAFWEDANGGEFVIAEVIGDKIKPPAEDDDIGSGERDG